MKEEKEEFNQLEYIQQYNKENYKRKSVYLRQEELDDLEKVLKIKKISLKKYLMNYVKADLKKE